MELLTERCIILLLNLMFILLISHIGKSFPEREEVNEAVNEVMIQNVISTIKLCIIRAYVNGSAHVHLVSGRPLRVTVKLYHFGLISFRIYDRENDNVVYIRDFIPVNINLEDSLRFELGRGINDIFLERKEREFKVKIECLVSH